MYQFMDRYPQFLYIILLLKPEFSYDLEKTSSHLREDCLTELKMSASPPVAYNLLEYQEYILSVYEKNTLIVILFFVQQNPSA